MKKLLSIILLFASFSTFCACNSSKEKEKDQSTPYFSGKVIGKHENGFTVEVTDSGNGSFAIGEKVWVNTDIFTDCEIGDVLEISFDGKVALSLPPQIMSVSDVKKLDGPK